jgi:hypothetical protein
MWSKLAKLSGAGLSAFIAGKFEDTFHIRVHFLGTAVYYRDDLRLQAASIIDP